MARGTWLIELWNGTSFVSDGALYRPNANVELSSMSTQQKIALASGAKAFFTPETLYNTEDIVFEFLEIYPSDSFYNKITNYIEDHSYVRITTHLGETFTGRFLSIKRVWLVNVDDTFDFQVLFQRMD
jgi:hypothetical protein